MRTRTSTALALVLLIVALIAAACGQAGGAQSPTAPGARATASAGGQAPTAAADASPAPSQAGAQAPADTLRWPVEGLSELTSLDPATPGDAPNNAVITLIFSGLVRLDPQLEVIPDGASEWKVSADGTVYTFTIREGLKFGDGTPITAEDFVYSINRAVAPDTGGYAASSHFGHILGVPEVLSGQAETVSGVRAVDERTLEIKLDAPIAYFLALLTYPDTFVVPRKLVEGGDEWQEQAYGSGPYRVKEWKHGQSILLEANQHYWQGTPGVPFIHMPFTKDTEVAYQLYQTGDLDIQGGGQNSVPAAHVAEVQNLPDFHSVADLRTRYVGFNFKQPPFDNADVRRAFALAIDKPTLANQVLAGTALPADRILPTGLLGTHIPIRPLLFDPDAAKQALARAGYPNGQGLPDLTLAYGEEGDNQYVVEALQSMWEQHLGVKVQLEGFEIPTFSGHLDTTYYTPTQGLQFYYSVWGADYPDPQNFLSQLFYTGKPNNNGHFSNTNFDRLVSEADRLGDRAQIDRRIQLYNQAEQIVIDEVGWIPIVYPKLNVLVSPRVEGIAVTPQGLIVPDWSKLRLK
jgi:peptide/nickel transport system substrate-binding protein/oligopeptide transport system substrate-binding protein